MAQENGSVRGQVNGGAMLTTQPSERSLLTCLLARLQVRWIQREGEGVGALKSMDGRRDREAHMPAGQAAGALQSVRGGRGRGRYSQGEGEGGCSHPPCPPSFRLLSLTLLLVPSSSFLSPSSQALDADVVVGHNIGAGDLTTLLYRMQHHKASVDRGTESVDGERKRGTRRRMCFTVCLWRQRGLMDQG